MHVSAPANEHPRRRLRLLASAGLLCALGAGFLVWQQLARSDAQSLDRHDAQQAVRADLLAQGQRAYAELPILPLAGQSAAELESLLANSSVARDDAAPLPDAAMAQLWRCAAEFLYYQVINADPDQYAMWRRSRGYVLRDEKKLRHWLGGEMYFEHFAGRKWEEGTPGERAFAELWRITRGAEGDHAKAACMQGICSDPKGLATVLGRLDPATPARRKPIEGVMPKEIWIGGFGGASLAWWHRPQDQWTHDVLYADVGVVAEFGNKNRRPIVMTFYWHPVDRTWILQFINQYNFDPAYGGVLIY